MSADVNPYTGDGAIEVAFVNDYKSTIQFLLQQKGSLFRGAVTEDSYTGKAGKAVEQFGVSSAQKRTTRHSDTPIMSVDQDARWVYPVDYEWGDLIDSQDKLRMIIDPTNGKTQSGAMAMQRAFDDEIIAAFFAASYVGENGSDTETFDTTNYQVASTVGGTASNLNVAKLQAAMKMLLTANKGALMEPAYCAISAQEHDSLLKEIQVVNKDYSNSAVLEDGFVKRFMGFNFILTERLTNDGTYRSLPVWVKSGMHLGVWDDLTAKITPRADKSYATQIYLSETIGATRLMQGKVVQILSTM